MDNIWLLVKIQLLQLTGFNKARYANSKREKRKWTAIYCGSFFLIAYMLAVGFLYSYRMASMLEKSGSLDYLLGLMMAAASLMSCMVTLYKVNGMLFGFKDYDILMSLPIRTSSIVASRIVILYILNILFSLMVMVPAGLVYAVKALPGPSYYLIFTLTVLAIPIVPIIVATFIGYLTNIIVMHFKYANLLHLLVTFAVLIAFMAGMLSMFGGSGDLTERCIDLMGKMNTFYPLAHWYMEAVCQGSIPFFFLFVVSSMGIFIVFTFTVSKRYKQINTTLMAVQRKGQFLLGSQEASSPFVALYKKELKRYFSTNVYVLNTGFGIVLYTLLSVAVLFTGLDFLGEMVQVKHFAQYAIQFAPFISSVFIVLSCTTMCSLSLEGKNIWIIQTAPVSAQTVFLSKMAVNLTITVPAILCNNLLLLFVIKGPFLESLLLFAIPLTYAVWTALTGIVLNLAFPNFDWTSEMAVVKQSVASFLSIMLGLASVMLPIAIVLLVPSAERTITIILLWFALMLLSFFLFVFLRKKGEGRLMKIG
ncbi:hypothetical protein [Bacillus sp. 1P06AnD]|uniref:hypothetical protein n=1 Tax=Bacillus sp. 1P06AnD TaxID=3132208 RepID=UPI00399FFE85